MEEKDQPKEYSRENSTTTNEFTLEKGKVSLKIFIDIDDDILLNIFIKPVKRFTEKSFFVFQATSIIK